MAAFCVATRCPPSEYLSLSRAERDAFVRLLSKQR